VKQKKITILVETGYIGMAIIRRVSSGRHVILSDRSEDNAATDTKQLEDTVF